jgi:hypothetical protein
VFNGSSKPVDGRDGIRNSIHPVLGAANGMFRALKTPDMADDRIVRKLEKRAF